MSVFLNHALAVKLLGYRCGFKMQCLSFKYFFSCRLFLWWVVGTCLQTSVNYTATALNQ